MKKQQLFLLLLLLAAAPTCIFAMTVATDSLDQTESNIVTTEFGLSGKISKYQADKASITIDGISYILDGKGSLTDSDLLIGTKIYFNVESSSTESLLGHITKIWIEVGNGNE